MRKRRVKDFAKQKLETVTALSAKESVVSGKKWGGGSGTLDVKKARGLYAIRWLTTTVLVFCLAGILVLYGVTREQQNADPLYGKPVDVPAGQVMLACPAVPPTVNPQAVDGEGNPLSSPQIAGSVTAAVLARGGKTPEQAVYQGIVPATTEAKPTAELAKGSEPTASEKTTAENTAASAQTGFLPEEQNQVDGMSFAPRSAMLIAQSTQAVPGFFTAAPWEGKAALAAAAIEQSVSSGDFRGLATATCLPAAQESWLVGGATEPGHSTVVQLLNHANNPVKARVEVWGDTGKMAFARGENLTVNSKASLELPLEAQLAGQERLVVRVLASGAGVAASMQTRSLLGLTPGGVSLVHPSSRAAQVQVIPGMVLNADLGSVRILNPGAEPVRASISMVGAEGSFRVPGADDIVLDPDAVVDFTLGGVPEGNYAVLVNGTGPLVAGAVVYRQGAASATDEGKFARDHAWLPSLTSGGGVVMGPEQVERQLLVTNLNANTAEYLVGGTKYRVNPNTTAVVELRAEIPQLVVAPNLYVTQLLTTNLGDGLGIDSLEPMPDLDAARQVFVHLNS